MSRLSITAGALVPALRVVRATEVPAGAKIWGYREADTGPHFVLFSTCADCPDGAQLGREGRNIVWLGSGFGDAEHDALILIEEIA